MISTSQLPENYNLIGAVLAGGKSSRMGTDKAQLSIFGKTMLSRTQELVTELGAKDVLVCRNERGFVEDKLPNSGPVGGIYSVLEHLLPSNKKYLPTNQYDALLVVPVDMPLLDKETLAELVYSGAKIDSPLRFSEQQFPLFLPINEEIKECARVVASSSNRSIKCFLRFIGCESINATRELPFFNTNNPAQWKKAVEQLYI